MPAVKGLDCPAPQSRFLARASGKGKCWESINTFKCKYELGTVDGTFLFFSGRWLLVSLKVLSSLHSISPPIESQLAPAAAAQGIEGGGGKKLHH